ncbi:MAG TPA: lysophospholipid acyltransferase family protein [Brevundimonas sp.]|jgi:1-acyl-sn-glycerol-3-phosphate acyltransferase|uniref:lysophospholipid acyltransferase family protein n=1 Tax=Brevundimonas sp. TaxID=1871086 RepID=UPI002C8FFD9B|nr:lysophospholipid acyltransferase family protein [Brevundimonas sp.]HRH21318.1 lysophospholipid acyltransferase family protein [Brevundimonas sp.]
MLSLRRALFALWLYLSMPICAVGMSPALLMSHRPAMGVIKIWARMVLFGLRWIMGITVEVRGLENRPTGAALVAPKHQSMLDIVVPFTVLDDPCFVLKKELMIVPFIGWFAWKTKMIPVDRSAHAKALKDMVRNARARLAEGRQVVIFPEGTRQLPGAEPDYKPGVAAIYRDLEGPCWPVATNAGEHWPAKGIGFKPGRVIFNYLPPLPPGLKRAEFMNRLAASIEQASAEISSRPEGAVTRRSVSVPVREPA